MKHFILTVAVFASLYMASDAFYVVRGFQPSLPGQQVLLGSGTAARSQYLSPVGHQPTMIIIDPSTMTRGFSALPPSSAPLPIAPASTPVNVPVAAVRPAPAARTVTSGSPPPPRAGATSDTSHNNDFFSYMLADQMDYPLALLATRNGGLFGGSSRGGAGGRDFFSRYMMMDAMDFPSIF